MDEEKNGQNYHQKEEQQPSDDTQIDITKLTSARPEIWKNEITGHQKNKIPVAATLDW